MSIRETEITVLKRQYPHVDNVTDWRAQQSLRLLWDRIFALEERLQATEATQGDLVNELNRQEDALEQADRKGDEALAIAQLLQSEQARLAGAAPGTPTIPDYYDIVVATLATFDPVIPEADEEAGKAQLTRAAAWAIYAVDTNIGLLEKTYGTEVNGRSVDIVVQMTDGSFADVASATNNGDGTVTIVATWSAHVGDSNTTDEDRWIVPTAAIAAETGPMDPA